MVTEQESPAASFFETLANYPAVQGLIDSGEAEGQFLECKAPREPRLTREMKAKLAVAASGFANSGGGVILWGVSTTRQEHSNLDVLSQIQPIGNIRRFTQQVDQLLPTLTTPSLPTKGTKILHQSRSDTRGIGVTLIPPTAGDPVQSTVDNLFHLRTGESFILAPYEILQRMFAGAAGPILEPVFRENIVSRDDAGVWKFPVILKNNSSAAARDVKLTLWITNPEACSSVEVDDLRDASDVNPGETLFMGDVSGPVYRGLEALVGYVKVAMKMGSRPRRVLHIRVRVMADRMRAKDWTFRIQLARTGFSVRKTGESFIY